MFIEKEKFGSPLRIVSMRNGLKFIVQIRVGHTTNPFFHVLKGVVWIHFWIVGIDADEPDPHRVSISSHRL